MNKMLLSDIIHNNETFQTKLIQELKELGEKIIHVDDLDSAIDGCLRAELSIRITPMANCRIQLQT